MRLLQLLSILADLLKRQCECSCIVRIGKAEEPKSD